MVAPVAEDSTTVAAVSPVAVATPVMIAQAMYWVKRYGWQTTVLLLLAQATGILSQAQTTLGGMC